MGTVTSTKPGFFFVLNPSTSEETQYLFVTCSGKGHLQVVKAGCSDGIKPVHCFLENSTESFLLLKFCLKQKKKKDLLDLDLCEVWSMTHWGGVHKTLSCEDAAELSINPPQKKSDRDIPWTDLLLLHSTSRGSSVLSLSLTHLIHSVTLSSRFQISCCVPARSQSILLVRSQINIEQAVVCGILAWSCFRISQAHTQTRKKPVVQAEDFLLTWNKVLSLF